MAKAIFVALTLGMILLNFTGHCHSTLQFGFYNGKCNGADVEGIVKGVIEESAKKDPTLVAALLRMQFHDCFVNGCDASILLDGDKSERTAPPNFSVRGYEVIDAAKAAVEQKCPGVVSCADIIIMATRDAVATSHGGRYNVQNGRRDGTVSQAGNVNLPGPSISVSDSIKLFAKNGLSSTDMVYLLGGHTVGVTHCVFVQDRLYNFRKTGRPDPSMDVFLLNSLRSKCPQSGNSNSSIDLDQGFGSSLVVDKSYYQQTLFRRRGILEIDQALAFDPQTKGAVTAAAVGSDFTFKFGEALVKLGGVGVLTGSEGEIRQSCRAVNKH